jgi:hypothetical protein
MSKRILALLLFAGACAWVVTAQAAVAPCPGYDASNNTNLGCEIATATRTSGQSSSLGLLSPTLAAQLSQLPMATAVTGTGLSFSRELGVFTASNDSLGTILTQRGDTMGRHKLFVSFTFQHFAFNTVDGVNLHDLPTVNVVSYSGNAGTSYTQATSSVDLQVNQYTALAAYGLTKRIDVSLVMPFSDVRLSTVSNVTQYNASASGSPVGSPFALPAVSLPGSAFGLGDITASVKVNVFKAEAVSVAVGSDVRFPTGDAANYLGTGAYGVRPYLVFSRRGRLTPNVNLSYQANGRSELFMDPQTAVHEHLPGSVGYSGGVDFRVVKQFTLTSEFLGQYVVNGPRVDLGTLNIPGAGLTPTVSTVRGSYCMDNLGAGWKINPYKGLLFSGNVLFKLDDAGLRAKVIPLIGASYRF